MSAITVGSITDITQ